MEISLLVPVLAGWLAGWAVNYLADVLPAARRLRSPTCPQCSTAYAWSDYLMFRACRSCGRGRGLRPWIVQGLMLAVSLYTWFRPHRMGYLLAMALLTYFAVVFVVDLEHRLILHLTSLFGALLGLGIGASLNGLLPTLIGGAAGAIIMLALYGLGVLFSRFRARRLLAAGQADDHEEALGAGDVILAGILGLILSWPLIWFGLLLGILLGGLMGILLVLFLVVSGRYKNQALTVFMPYGPFFVLSAFFIMFLPNWLTAVVPK